MRVQCNCGKTLKVGDHLAGKQIRCPACGESLLAEEPVEVTELAEPVKRKGKSRPEPEEEDDEEERPQPKSKKKKRKPEASFLARYGLLIGLGAGAAVSGVAVVIVLMIVNARPNDNAATASNSNKAPSEGKPNQDPIVRPASDSTKPGVSKPADDLFAAPADVKLTADQLAKEFKENERAAREKYKDKLIELTGAIRYVSQGDAGEKFIQFKLTGNLEISVKTSDPKLFEQISKGQIIKLKVRGPMNSPGSIPIGLSGGPILEASGNPPTLMTAQELAKVFDVPDRVPVCKDYSERFLFVTGEVDQIARTEYGTYHFFVKTGTNLRIHVQPYLKSLPGIQVGSKVKFTGQFTGPFSAAGTEIYVTPAAIVEILK